MSIAEIKKEHEKKYSELLEKLGIFFAFGNEQFNRQKQEGVVYVSMGAGMIAPKDRVPDFIEGYSQIDKEIQEMYHSNVDMDKYISYCLNNYEAYYTCDLEDSFKDAKNIYPNCTIEDVRKVFRENRSKYTD